MNLTLVRTYIKTAWTSATTTNSITIIYNHKIIYYNNGSLELAFVLSSNDLAANIRARFAGL